MKDLPEVDKSNSKEGIHLAVAENSIQVIHMYPIISI